MFFYSLLEAGRKPPQNRKFKFKVNVKIRYHLSYLNKKANVDIFHTWPFYTKYLLILY